VKLHKLTASFGKLQNDSLVLGDGLNVIFAPNESGKSTWCGFIQAMLYGIDSSAREKGGVKPDKLRFAPWSGAPMAGSMEIEYAEKKITLIRKGRESAPMRDFSAVITGTSDQVRELEAASVGETLLGVSKDVFERSAFIGQGRMSVSSSPELEKRISAIVQTGEEKSSFSEAEERLRAALRKRRYHKSGRLSEIEKEMESIRAELGDCEREAGRGADLKKAKAAALERRDSLLDRVSEARKRARRGTRDRLTESRGDIRALETAYFEKAGARVSAEKKLETGLFGKETPQAARLRVAEDRARLTAIEQEEGKGGSGALNWMICALLMLIGVGFELLVDFRVWTPPGFLGYVPRIAAGVLALIQLARILTLRRKRKALLAEKTGILSGYGCERAEQITALLKAHEQNHAAFILADEAEKQAEIALEAAKQLQAELEAVLLKDLDFTEGESEAAQQTKLLEAAEAALRNIREQSAAWEGRQTALKDPGLLRARLAELAGEHGKLTEEYDALALALDTLRSAGAEISQHVTPRLSERTAEIFSAFTGARYGGVMLDRELKALARPQGDAVPRDASFLSVGTVDQLYLAVRLAVCELALPADKACPLILDDALVNFDDTRCERALALLRTLAEQRQILLFTCHKREMDLVAGLAAVTVTELKDQ
jgi:uncharacterized protein YhaN